ncbi:hypothetical protein BEN74_07545 [Acinetobacter sp. WCHAc010034]|uniref:hypothetical protein n=1 Tax=Acinetobacter sp. WCHAc010034 TaxID=1879049 RepID=UPI00083AC29E|nr:hypothetical protein [Acinetobacter sp. WCHAc010034]AYA02716.1 hypothetical protein BEN74_07545 [Acinetobacter sp. WCHAc010034]MBL8320868.1 hypothetical protein [Acinetobacter sp.]
MSKKKDVFGKKLTLTQKEKADHKNRMEKFETLSLYWVQAQRYCEAIYTILVQAGKLVFPNEHIRQKLFDLLVTLVKKFGWWLMSPILFQLISDQFVLSDLFNSFFL